MKGKAIKLLKDKAGDYLYLGIYKDLLKATESTN